MRQKLYLMSIMLTIFTLCVNANINWFQEGNADLNLPGSQGFIGYGTNLNNIFTNFSYTKCDMPISLFTPVATDFDQDGSIDYVYSVTNKLEIYTTGCQQKWEISLGENANAMPVLVNFDADTNQEIAVLLDDSLDFYEYNSTLDIFTLQKSMNYSDIEAGDLSLLTCFRTSAVADSRCLAFLRSGDYHAFLFHYANDTVEEKDPLPASTGMGAALSGLSNSRTFGDTNFLAPLCTERNGANTQQECLVMNSTGDLKLQYTSITTGGVLSSINHDHAFVARIGSISRILHSTSNNLQKGFSIADTSGNVLLTSLNASSNWAVADFSKDGNNEICHLVNISDQYYFRCYTAAGDVSLSHNMTGIMNFTWSLVMADFNYSQSTLGIGTVEGIFYPLPSPHIEYSTGIPATIAMDGSAIVVSRALSKTPTVIYNDDTFSIMYENLQVVESCGNGVCDNFENSFSCPIDCGSQANGTCFSDGDCPISFPKCHGNKCVSGFNDTLTCNFNTDCPFSSPICYAFRCVQGISGGVPGSGAGNTTIDDSITDTLDILLGTSPLLKFIMGIAIIIGIVIAAGQVTNNVFILTLIALLTMFLMSLLTLIPMYVSILVAISTIGIAIFVSVMNRGNGG